MTTLQPTTLLLDRTPSARAWTAAIAARSDLPAAGQLSIVLQPIVRLADGQTAGLEVLARCCFLDLAPPELLFQRATKHGLAGLLGRMIRERTRDITGAWQLFINLHAGELDDDLVFSPQDPLGSGSHVPVLEIAETLPALRAQKLAELVEQTQAPLAIDDFGAGLSDLAKIADLSPSFVKLAHSLTRGLEHRQRQQRLVKNVARLCETMSARVIAEGVETAEQHNALRDCGIELAQGYYYARPNFPWSPPRI